MQGTRWKFLVSLGLVSLGAICSAQEPVPSQILRTPFGEHPVPYTPTLTAATNPELCEVLLADAIRLYSTDTYKLDITGESVLTQSLASTVTPEAFMALGDDVPIGSIAIADIKTDPMYPAKFYAIHAFSDTGPLYLGLHHYRTTGFNTADTLVTFSSLSALRDAILLAMDENLRGPITARARVLLDSSDTRDWWFDRSHLFMYENTLYLLRTPRTEGTTPESVSLLALEAFRENRPVCTLQWRPTEYVYPAPPPSPVPGLPLLRDMLVKVWMGSSETYCAVSNGCTPAIDDVRMTMLQRPWASTRRGSSPQLNYNTVSRMDAGLAERALYSNVAREENRQIQKLRPQVKEELAAYYQSVFGLERQLAMQLAADWADFFYTAGFSFTPEGYDWQSRRWNMDRPYEDPQVSLARRQFRELLNAEAPLDQFAELIQNLKQSAPQGTFKDMLPLADVVHMPELLALMLQEAEEVEDFNRFYKSALMNAAHRNSLESVRLLVEAGAQVNARTMVGQGNTMIGNRVALHYALENASEELVAFLLENGADTLAIDSRNRSVQEYLKLSKRSEEEKERIRQMLAQYPQFWWDTVP